MPGAGAGDTQVNRLADAVRDAIVANMDRLLVAGGKAVVSIFDVSGTPRIELTSTQCIPPHDVTASGQPAASRLPDEISQLAEHVRRGLIANCNLVKAARRIDVEIQMRGARPDLEFIYRCRQP